MDEEKLTEKAPEGIGDKPEMALAAGAAASLPVGTVHVGTIELPGVKLARHFLTAPYEMLDKTIATFEDVASNGGRMTFRNRMRGRIDPTIHRMVAKLSLL